MTVRIEYKDYTIYYDPKPFLGLDWNWVHKDYDGEDDPRHGYANSIDDAKAMIDFQIEDAE